MFNTFLGFFYYQAQTEYLIYNMETCYFYFQQTDLVMRAVNKSAAIQECVTLVGTANHRLQVRRHSTQNHCFQTYPVADPVRS